MYMSVFYTYTIDLQSQQHSQQYCNRTTTTMQLYTFRSKGFPYVKVKTSPILSAYSLQIIPLSLSIQPTDCPSASQHRLQIFPLSLSTQPIEHLSVSQHTAYRASLSLSTQPIHRPSFSQDTVCRSSFSLSANSLQIIPLSLIIQTSPQTCENDIDTDS